MLFLDFACPWLLLKECLIDADTKQTLDITRINIPDESELCFSSVLIIKLILVMNLEKAGTDWKTVFPHVWDQCGSQFDGTLHIS